MKDDIIEKDSVEVKSDEVEPLPMADIEINLETTDAKELLRSGHHAFIMKDYANAAAAFGKATQLMAQEHGDENDILGEIYLRYGRALLECSREESDAIGDAIPRESDSDDDDEEEAPGDSEQKTEEKPEETVTNGVHEAGDTPNGPGPSTNGDVPGPSNGVSDEPSDENAEKEEPSDLQLAWEVLEVAKKIFTARADKGQELLSETLILLGEVGMESENFADAVKDIQAGLEIQETLYEENNRKLAETQYKLGIAHSTLSNIEDAVKYFEKSIETLNKRTETLKVIDDDSSKKEMEEIVELIPEIKEKINDVKSIKEDTVKMLMEMSSKQTESPDASSSSGQSTSTSKEVKDISHLVKRKRKSEDPEESSEVQPTKKPTP